MGKFGYTSLKLNMSNTYDRIELDLLEITMYMGFHAKWVELIMRCLNIISFSILINGVPKGPITLSKGLVREILYQYNFFYNALRVE